MINEASSLIDTDAQNKAVDADAALQELGSDEIGEAFVTATVTVENLATVHRDLVVYAEIFARESSQPISDPVKLIAPMLARFMATDRAFARQKAD